MRAAFHSDQRATAKPVFTLGGGIDLDKAWNNRNARLILLTGIVPPAALALASSFVRARRGVPAILICPDAKSASEAGENLRFFAGLRGVLPPDTAFLPEKAPLAQAGRPGLEEEMDRLTALCKLRRAITGRKPEDPGFVLIATARSILQEVPSPADLDRKEIRLRPGEETDFTELIETLRSFEYDCETVCEAPGEYAVRGGIIDVYPVTAPAPCRLDFFGNLLEEIRSFDPATQRSDKTLQEVFVTASPNARFSPSPGGIADYLGEKVNWIVWEPHAAERENADTDRREAGGGAMRSLLSLRRVRAAKEDSWLGMSDLSDGTELFPSETIRLSRATELLSPYRFFPHGEQIGEVRLAAEQDSRQKFFQQLLRWQNEGHRILLVTRNEGEEERLREILADNKELPGFSPAFHRGPLEEGFRLPPGAGIPLHWFGLKASKQGLVIVSDSEIFGRHRQRKTGGRKRALVNKAQVDQLLDFSELAEGDYLVHILHGICLFRGIGRIESRGQIREVISLEFADGILLHVPLHESHLLSRYVGLTKARPVLGRIGSKQWEKTRRAAERGILDMAAELLGLQAARESQPGHAFSPDVPWQREFEDSFIHEPTPDQIRAIAECKADMEKARPMDRLLCGDVGYGKTEVAIRAAFKAVMDGRQVAVLAPTTVLAQQHFRTFRERMADYPVVVEMLSRFRTPSQRKEILRGLKKGGIDIVIGTHSLLGRGIAFNRLGLVVVDEEHRFGVRHKEHLKRMRQTVDILTMSATPIPRTLHLALTGARDLSVMETAPVNRLPIKTMVEPYDDGLVAGAIRREMARGGQVFYLHNRVMTIEAVAARLRELVPEAKVAIGHGQMPENRLERVMADFVDGKHDVLVCTTIIESGLDIPNCNTILIEAADRFGLSQLYQIRGRVGRFHHQAHAFLLLRRHGKVLDQARKRLSALRQHSHLGAGFRIAMRDLELRGAGNLLGAAQSGHIAGVGFDLYCQLLRQSIGRLKGEENAAAPRASVLLDFVVFGEGEPASDSRYEDGHTALKDDELKDFRCKPIQARLPAAYISETRLRIDFYRRLAMAGTITEVGEIEEAMRDRFGQPPTAAGALLAVTRIRCLAEEKRIISVETEGHWLKCRRASGMPDDFIKTGNRFPRLTRGEPLLRLKEIISFLQCQ